MTPRVAVIHGPNLNMLGRREPEIYGATTLAEIDAALRERAAAAGLALSSFQSNHEGALVDHIQSECWEAAGLIINPGALTHYGLALRDALAMLRTPIVEVHISNVYKREPFRHHSVISDIAAGSIIGFGSFGYHMALQWFTKGAANERS